MAIRRKSDANKTTESCAYHDQMVHERHNQHLHEKRQQAFPAHDPTAACWCCCAECTDLTWYYPPRKGLPSQLTGSFEPPSTPETCAGPPGSPETSTF